MYIKGGPIAKKTWNFVAEDPHIMILWKFEFFLSELSKHILRAVSLKKNLAKNKYKMAES